VVTEHLKCVKTSGALKGNIITTSLLFFVVLGDLLFCNRIV
jgi:hypothetical protein